MTEVQVDVNGGASADDHGGDFLPEATLATIMGRAPHSMDLEALATPFAGRRVLVTGGEGSLGSFLAQVLKDVGAITGSPDVDTGDVTALQEMVRWQSELAPEYVMHLAGMKHAPDGEVDPDLAFRVNVVGTQNVLAAMPDAHVTVTSTCKSIQPETCYGATKLLAERLVLNHGGSVARLYNTIETGGNVFEIWAAVPAGESLAVMPCTRFFITRDEAVGLVLHAALRPGRWAVNPGEPREMLAIAQALFPTREFRLVPPRRGDRAVEPRIGQHEAIVEAVGPFERIVGHHDFVQPDVQSGSAPLTGG